MILSTGQALTCTASTYDWRWGKPQTSKAAGLPCYVLCCSFTPGLSSPNGLAMQPLLDDALHTLFPAVGSVFPSL